MNLFWSTRTLTAAREDHLTEFIAAALDVSKPFRSAYADYVLHGLPKKIDSGTPQIQGVKTQVSFPGTTCCPDMVLTLSDGRIIACEHKLDVLETMGPEQDLRAQLKRYLDLPIDGLLYVRTSWKPPASEVLKDTKYLHPPDREHFLWRDFYPLLSSGSHVVLDWLREGFELLGFTPPHPSIFAKLWQRTRSQAHDLGWKVSSGSIVELYLSENSQSLASWIFISPAKFDRFLFRVTPREGGIKSVTARLQEAVGSLSQRTEIVQHQVTRKDGKEEVVDITTSLREILGTDPMSPEQIEAGLLDFVGPLLQSLQK